MEVPGLRVNWFHFVLALAGCVLAHAGANLISDYFDFRHNVDREETFGSSRILVEGAISPGRILAGSWVAFAIASAIGAYLVFTIPNGMFLIGLIALGGVLALFYTAKPVAFKYHALGDVAVFVSFGSAMTLGAYFVQAHTFSWSPVICTLPLGLLVDAILHGNNLRDIKHDRVAEIRTVAMMLGEGRAKLMYYALVFGAYLLTLALVLTGQLPPVSMATWLSLPLAVKLARIVGNKTGAPSEQFRMIDAATAQVHLAYSILLIVSLLSHHLFIA
jgi:1,4-dihydroxy-2-naphthoate octaprenyltransferase